MQTRLQSLWESWMNVIVGWVVAVLSQVIIFPPLWNNRSFSDQS